MIVRALFAAALAVGQEPPAESFERLWAIIRPGPGEALWDRIPWRTCLWEARQQAAAEGKPLLIWMNVGGNPIGLT